MIYMKKKPQSTRKTTNPSKKALPNDGHLMGSAILGERGQMVIPKDIRERLRLKSGARMLVMNHPNGPIVIFPLGQMQNMLDLMSKQVADALRTHPIPGDVE